MTPPLSIQTATVQFQSDALLIPAYLAHPAAAAGRPIVVVIQEVFGVNAHIRDVTERIAREGYIAIAPHIYHRQVAGFEVGYSDADLALGRQYKNGTQANELLQDIQGAIAYCRQHFSQVPVATGCVGFCFGGHVAYLAATLPDIQATGVFYGAGIPSFTPGGGPPTLTRTAAIQGTVHSFFREADPLIPATDIAQIEAALKENSVNYRIFRYPYVGHGFFCDQRDSYAPDAANDAWEHMKSLLRGVLKPHP
jgi:carboxymethylenebutenolidase